MSSKKLTTCENIELIELYLQENYELRYNVLSKKVGRTLWAAVAISVFVSVIQIGLRLAEQGYMRKMIHGCSYYNVVPRYAV